MSTQTTQTTGAGAIAAQKPVLFYYGEKAEQTPLERIDNLEKQLANACEMLATIEADGDHSSHLHGFYKSRVYKLGLKLDDLEMEFPPVFFGARHFVG